MLNLLQQQALSEPDGPHTVYYELLSSIVYVRDETVGGNLVAHVLVGDRYHKRKEGITHRTWYMFNDFAIQSTVKVSHLVCFLLI